MSRVVHIEILLFDDIWCSGYEMHDFYYKRLIEDATKFDPRPGNRFLEVLDSGEDTPVIFNEGEIAESKICDFVYQNLSTSVGQTVAHERENYANRGLRLLIGSPEEHHSDAKILPLSISRETFEHIRRAWHLPTELLRMMLSTLPMAIQFSTSDETSKSPIMGLIIRGGRSRDWNYCLGLAHDPATGVTCGLIQGLELGEIKQLRKCLQFSPEHFRQPALVPLFLIELKTHFFAVLLERRASALEETEYETGMKHGYSLDPRRNPALRLERRKSRVSLDFDPITQKLTSLTGTLAFCDLTFESSLRSLEVTMALSQNAVDNTSQVILPENSKYRRSLELRAAYLKTLIAGAQAHRNVLLQRTRAQVQTVYSLIGQRDNRLNIEIGDASKKIAEASLRDNAAMKAIAEDSKKVALLTRRDSTNMRIISVVTLFFLPGTFSATLFSTSFFNFQVSGSPQIVSSWVWLYFAVTTALTLIVLLTWWYFSRTQNIAILQYLEVKRESAHRKESNANEAAEMSEGGVDAQLTASLEAESSFDSENIWLDRKSSVVGSPD